MSRYLTKSNPKSSDFPRRHRGPEYSRGEHTETVRQAQTTALEGFSNNFGLPTNQEILTEGGNPYVMVLQEGDVSSFKSPSVQYLT